MSQTRAIGWAVVLLLLGGSCTERLSPSNQQEGTESTDRLRDLLIAEIRQRSQTPPFAFSVTDSAVEFAEEPSAVFPGVTFIWATYRSRQVWHAFVSAVGGVRGDSARVIKNTADWWAFAPVGKPLNEGALADACRELVHVTRGMSHMDGTRLYNPMARNPEFLPEEEKTVRRRTGHEAYSIQLRPEPDSVWLIRAWLVRPTEQVLATRYECAIPPTHVPDGPIPRITVLDSVPRY